MSTSSSKSKPTRVRKRVEAETTSLKRARDGSAFHGYRKKSVPSEKTKKVQKEKKVKDPNMPKRPATAFFLFM
ncbi:hypothetical protein QJS10_CPB11g02336 [Acorus calamus]|uniref:Uncharacterized protein n=1 Tax=Acorus calamus TaxID=4465 RepID=A0AAV9DUU2_ACOCL|nr:hypothetical protein QJS10_CPB11g02336 [Acorus calamus]